MQIVEARQRRCLGNLALPSACGHGVERRVDDSAAEDEVAWDGKGIENGRCFEKETGRDWNWHFVRLVS